MNSNAAQFTMQPAEVSEAARQLTELADRIDRVMQIEQPNLKVTPSGSDEVSARVAGTLNVVNDLFWTANAGGVKEIREVAAALRAHTGDVLAAEQEFVA